MVFGGAGGIKTLSKSAKEDLGVAFSEIATIASKKGAIIIDGGTKSGVMVSKNVACEFTKRK